MTDEPQLYVSIEDPRRWCQCYFRNYDEGSRGLAELKALLAERNKLEKETETLDRKCMDLIGDLNRMRRRYEALRDLIDIKIKPARD